ncbi:hypothetical protein AKJ16_DCAP19355 [Drosera capensis]
MDEQIEDLELLMMLTTKQPDLNAPAPEEASVGGDGPRMEGPSVSTPVITTAEAVAAPAAQSSSAAPMPMPRLGSAKHVKFWEFPVGDLMVLLLRTTLYALLDIPLELYLSCWMWSKHCNWNLSCIKKFLSGNYTMKIGYMVKQQMNETGDVTWQGSPCITGLAKELHEVLAKMQNENSQSDSHPQKQQPIRFTSTTAATTFPGTTVANSSTAKPAATCCADQTSTGGAEATRTASWPAPRASTSSPASAAAAAYFSAPATRSPATATASSLPTASPIGPEATSSTSGPAATAMAS